MAITKCRECGGRVSTEAATCPHCGVSQPASQQKPATAPPVKKKSSFWKITGLVVVVLWIIGTVSQQTARRSENQNAAATTTPAATAAETTGPQCFDSGDAIATVYLANIKYAVDVGMLASEMMNKGCQDSVGGQGAECVAECRLGFKAKAKQWVKDGSLN